jgi:hypothetical protein
MSLPQALMATIYITLKKLLRLSRKDEKKITEEYKKADRSIKRSNESDYSFSYLVSAPGKASSGQLVFLICSPLRFSGRP